MYHDNRRTLALRAAQLSAWRYYKIEWFNYWDERYPTNTEFNVHLDDEDRTLLRIISRFDNSKPWPVVKVEVRANETQPPDLHSVTVERHNSQYVILDSDEYTDRIGATPRYARILRHEWSTLRPPDDCETPLETFLENLARRTNEVRYAPVRVGDHWELYPVRPEDWVKSLPLDDLGDLVPVFLNHHASATAEV